MSILHLVTSPQGDKVLPKKEAYSLYKELTESEWTKDVDKWRIKIYRLVLEKEHTIEGKGSPEGW